MPDLRPQSFATHRNFPALFFRVATPLVLVSLALAVAVLWRERSLVGIALLAGSVAMVVCLLAARVMANTVQDRVIRLEMRLRLLEVLPSDLHPRIADLSLRQLVGLRFASDRELPDLVARCLSGELKGSEAVKRAVRDWQPDFLRA
jgi:hypothetical protein